MSNILQLKPKGWGCYKNSYIIGQEVSGFLSHMHTLKINHKGCAVQVKAISDKIVSVQHLPKSTGYVRRRLTKYEILNKEVKRIKLPTISLICLQMSYTSGYLISSQKLFVYSSCDWVALNCYNYDMLYVC